MTRLAVAPSDPRRDIRTLAGSVAGAANALLAEAVASVRKKVLADGQLSSEMLEAEQAATHGLSWLATYVESIRQISAYVERLSADGRLGALEETLARIAIGEYAAQILGGIPMSQGEIVRLASLGLSERAVAAFTTDAVAAAIADGNTPENRTTVVAAFESVHGGLIGDPGLDETLDQIRGEMRRFVEPGGAPRPCLAPRQRLIPMR